MLFEFHSASRLAGGRTRLTFAMPRGHSYLLQASSDLLNWIDLNSTRPLVNSTEFTVPATTPLARQFYRAEKVP